MIRQAMQTRARIRPGLDSQQGFTLIELMIVVAIIAVLTIVAMSSYTWAVTKTRRKEGAACAEQGSQWMERFYATNLRYDQDLAGNAVTKTFPSTASLCNAEADVSTYYTVALTNLSATTYQVNATPKGIQAKNDHLCATLSTTQLGNKKDSGTSSGTPANCW
jgi:type IV pilus assembly protein PilE